MECDIDASSGCSLVTDCDKDIVSCLLQTQMALFSVDAFIVRKGNLDKGNFFNEYIEENREYIPIKISISRLRDDGTKDDKDQMQITEDIQGFYNGSIKIKRTDMILYNGAYYDCRDLFTQEWNDDGEYIYQKFRMTFVQIANDFPDNVAPQ